MNQDVYCDPGCLSLVGEVLGQLSVKNLLLVTGKQSYTVSGAQSSLEETLKRYLVHRFSEFSPNPTLDNLQAGLARAKRFHPDVVMAVGGGSALDMGKLIAFFCGLEAVSLEHLNRPCDHEGPQRVPVLAIPTTAGSGSESTHFAVLYVDGVKYSVAAPSMMPAHVFVDAQLGLSLSPYQKAVSGIDAVCQSIESVWALGGTETSRRDALESLVLLWENLPVFIDSRDVGVANLVFRGAHLAGNAINVSRTTACHALAYSLTSNYGVPHGHAVGLFMAPVFSLNASVSEFTRQEDAVLGEVRNTIVALCDVLSLVSPDAFQESWRSFMKSIHLPSRLREVVPVGLPAVTDTVLGSVNMDRLGNNPRMFTSEDIRSIVAAAY
jgi:alcohol dehydrogenase class IV